MYIHVCAYMCMCLYNVCVCTYVSLIGSLPIQIGAKVPMSLPVAADSKQVLNSCSAERFKDKGKLHGSKQLKLHPGNCGPFPRKLHTVSTNCLYRLFC